MIPLRGGADVTAVEEATLDDALAAAREAFSLRYRTEFGFDLAERWVGGPLSSRLNRAWLLPATLPHMVLHMPWATPVRRDCASAGTSLWTTSACEVRCEAPASLAAS
jgi:hypothetical protein